MINLFVLSFIDPIDSFILTVFILFCVTFFAATQEIVMLAYQAERLGRSQFGAGEAMCVFGYRMGMLVSGAGALHLSNFFTWNEIYLFMSLLCIVGIITTLSISEPKVLHNNNYDYQDKYLKKYKSVYSNLSHSASKILVLIHHSILSPFVDFVKNPGWYVVILIMLFYKLGDNLIGTMSNLFYLDLGFTSSEIAGASKVFGMWATILGGFVGGMLISRLGMIKSIFIFGLMHGFSILMYIFLEKFEGGVYFLYLSIALENITGGMRTTALFAFQFTLCNVSYAATQLALLTSCVHLGRTLCSSISGWLVDNLGWLDFFYLATISTIPSLIFVIWISNITGESFFVTKK